MPYGKGAGTTKPEPAPVGPAGDGGPIKPPGGTKTVLRVTVPGPATLVSHWQAGFAHLRVRVTLGSWGLP